MIRYIKLYNEFLDFLKATSTDISDSYEKKVINLILDHFDKVAECGTAQGKRGQLINDLIQKYGASVSDSLPVFEGNQNQKVYPFSRLKYLEIEDFRGFSHKEIIALDKKHTFVYGLNGSGKSSFCEAIEYAMLGYIDEAIARRIEIGEYINNRFTGTKRHPILKAVIDTGDEMEVTADSSLYNFCFIEKNRIEDFGRISANTPNEKQNLLAAIFGLSEFNDFVGNFTRNIDRYIDIVGLKRQELERKSSGVQTQKDNLAEAQKELKSLEDKKLEIVANSDLSITFDELEPFIHGNDEKKGRLGILNELLEQETARSVSAISASNIDNDVRHLAEIAEQAEKLHVRYKSMRDKVCFRKMYATAVELEMYSPSKCPLCETPTSQAVTNPFENAKNKLLELADIAQLEADIESHSSNLRRQFVELVRKLAIRKNVCEALAIEYPGPALNDDVDMGGVDLLALIRLVETAVSQWHSSHLQQDVIDGQVAKHNEKAQNQKAERHKLDAERKQLFELFRNITETKTITASEQGTIGKCEKAIAEFNNANAILIEEAKAETVIIQENQKFVSAYSTFLDRLTQYKDTLPTLHLKELNSLTLEIYNAINASDTRFEKAASIVLPAALDDSIKIAFIDDPAREFDALHILSEGHIRCLGLAILLAKNVQLGCPLIVFDDVVNAIDDDHRGDIRTFICNSPMLASKQIILTTHAEQFVKELEQHFTGTSYKTDVTKLVFIADQEDRRLRIKHDLHQNYLYKIKEACEDVQWSEALYNCRCLLESLSHKLWKKISNAGFKTDFAVIIRAPNGIPDLMSVVESMNSFLKKHGDGKYDKITEIFDYLIGIETISKVIWNYLNKGTHEEEGKIEFDHRIVKDIAEKLSALDELVKA
jgi:AAA15 family ATPase/GTPase